MPFTQRDGTRIYWKLEGQKDHPPLVLLNSIGTDMSLWEPTLALLRPHFRLLRIDMRGHGASDAPGGDYRLAQLADDVAAVMSDAGIARAAIAGVSLGGMVAMEIALAHPERVSALVLICTSARMDRAAWQSRIDTLRQDGTGAIATMAVSRFLTPRFADRHPEIAESLRQSITAQSDDGYAGCAAAIRDMALIERIVSIAVPVLVVTGNSDIATPLTGHGDVLLACIPRSHHIALESAHLPPIEAPGALAASMRRFLAPRPDHDAAADALFDAGLANRRRILGNAWVDKSLAARTPFNADFQAMITRIAWHEIWGRPGLEDRTRRLLVLAFTASLGRWEEFELHVRAGLSQGGFTQDELKELLMQAAIYAGVPVANTGFAKAGRIIAELEDGSGTDRPD
ncbi:3-oxoadipate enol-lactonase [Acidisoma cellulosilytica]|uniref:3-oxoadipate enol-lactonase n=1 Tax=Acidisoma cellulosilyticum TaxID=2802395 RepID=A0A963Z2G1_9PROT|nr:3-oxoadipate enol-lactonase [Acidisoma cellulosilyticum]MCB8881530.1 3-oxoadipate enol-lactonase [Acidisoma cellulosilyticum]